MLKMIAVIVAMAACGVDQSAPPSSIGTREVTWACHTFSKCGGQPAVATQQLVKTSSSASDTELSLIDACEAQTCADALACSAHCCDPNDASCQ